MKNKFLVLFLTMCLLLSYLSALEQYVGAWGGVSLAVNKISGYNIDFSPGPAGGIIYGIQCPYNVKVEIKECYRQHHIDDIQVGAISSEVSGDLQKWAALVNLVYDFRTCHPLTPFVGLGIGWEYEKTELRAPGLH